VSRNKHFDRITRRVSQENFIERPIINPLLTKLVRSRWLDIGLVFFLCAKEEHGQYPAIWISYLVNNPYMLQVAVVADSPEKRVALGSLSGKLNIGKISSKPSLSE